MSSHIASSTRITRLVVAALLAAAAAVPASYAHASSPDDAIPSIKVNYSDLNLATKEGSHVLYQRLVYAARYVCPDSGHMMELRYNRDRQRCISSTVEHAVKEIKSPQFAQVAAGYMR